MFETANENRLLIPLGAKVPSLKMSLFFPFLHRIQYRQVV